MHATLADYILEIVQNAIESGAGRIDIAVRETAADIDFEIRDDGRGMCPEQLRRCRDPFFTDGGKHPGRAVGLGLAFVAQLAESANGELAVESTPGRGTRVAVRFDLRHPDTPPIGRLDELFLTALCFDGGQEIAIERRKTFADGEGRTYSLTRGEIRAALGDAADIANRSALRLFLREQEDRMGNTGGSAHGC